MRPRTPATLGLFALLILSASAMACTAPGDDSESNEAAATELTELKAYWADAKKLNLGDLTRVSVGFATDQLNDQLSGPSFGARFDPPGVYSAAGVRSSVIPDEMEVRPLDKIVSGLATRFGEKELGAEVNKLRLKHLNGQSDAAKKTQNEGKEADKYYVESAFTARLGGGYDWNFGADGFGDTQIKIGIDVGAELTSRVILATPDQKALTLLKTPLAAAKEMRGFVYPRSIADIKSMRPGEMFALRGVGKLGGNFGIGAPILIAEPTGALAYRIVVSAGVSAVIGGQLDVQLVRLEGDEVVVDVGVENGKGISFRAAIQDGFGVKGICEDPDGSKKPCLRSVELAGKTVNLARLVEKAVEKRVNSYMTFRIQGEASNASSRISLSRFRFHLDKGDPKEMERALERALKFDVRLAQAMYNRNLEQAEPAVTTEFDAVRAATTSTRSFGFELLGMNIYHRAVVKKEGSFVVQTPEGAKSILFDTVNKHGGWFQMDHGYKRTGIAAQTLDKANPESFRSEANLFIQTAVGDKHMDDDVIIDSIDSMLVGLGGPTDGPKLIDTLDKYGNDLEREVWSRCPIEEQRDRDRTTKTWDEECNVKLLEEPKMKQLKADGLAAIDSQISGMPDDYKKVIHEAANTRLSLQSVGIHNLDALNGPNASFTLDARFDDKALAILTSKSKKDYADALKEFLTVIRADRRKVGKDMKKDDVRADVQDKWGGAIEKMANKFEKRSQDYRLIMQAEKLIPSALRGAKFVSFPMGVRFSVDGDANRQLESAIIDSTSHDRAKAAARLFDDLREEADRINAALYDEHTAIFPLLALVPRENLEVGMDIQADVRSTFWVKRERYQKVGFKSVIVHAKGRDVTTIRAGLFDLDAILNGN